MKTHNRQLSRLLLRELYDLEEDAYRLSLREVKRMDGWSPGLALRPVIGHASETLGELPAMARDRHVDLASARSLAFDTFRRVCDRVIDQIVDHEHGYRRALTALRKSIDLVRVIQASAIEECDPSLSSWCQRWLAARVTLVACVSEELAWFGQHPFFARARLAAANQSPTPTLSTAAHPAPNANALLEEAA